MASTSLPDAMLDYLPLYRVVRCVACQYAVPPSAIPRHMKDLHHVYRAKRRALLDYAAGLDLANPEDLVLPEPHEPPIPSLPVEDGVACNDEACKYLSVTTKRMKRHWVTYHEKRGFEGTHWRSVKLQTFFRGNNLRYFIVTPAEESCDLREPLKTNQSLVQQRLTNVNPPTYSWDLSSLCSSALSFKTKDLELFHHYNISTCVGLVHRGEEASVWRTSVPQLGQDYPFLLNTILSITALHLAFLRPARRISCIAAAAHYQDLALSGFRSSVTKIDENNLLATFVFSRMMVVYALASGRESEIDHQDLKSNNEDEKDTLVLPEWLRLQRGAFKALRPYGRIIFAGPSNPFRPLMSIYANENADLTLNPCDAQLASLVPLFSSDTSSPSLSLFSDELANEVCALALAELRRAFAIPYVIPGIVKLRDAASFWPLRVPPPFFDLLTEEHPKALIVLAFYCVLLKRVEDYWYMKGHGKRLLSDIRRRLVLGWECWIEWPLQEVGLESNLDLAHDDLY